MRLLRSAALPAALLLAGILATAQAQDAPRLGLGIMGVRPGDRITKPVTVTLQAEGPAEIVTFSVDSKLVKITNRAPYTFTLDPARWLKDAPERPVTLAVTIQVGAKKMASLEMELVLARQGSGGAVLRGEIGR
jgi:hypothetical protein